MDVFFTLDKVAAFIRLQKEHQKMDGWLNNVRSDLLICSGQIAVAPHMVVDVDTSHDPIVVDPYPYLQDKKGGMIIPSYTSFFLVECPFSKGCCMILDQPLNHPR